jgi:hypothetical protein
MNQAIDPVPIAPALESLGAFVGPERPLKMLVHCAALLVVPSQPTVERARGNAVRNAFEWHSAGDHLRAQLCLDAPTNPGPKLIIKLGVFVCTRPAVVAGICALRAP